MSKRTQSSSASGEGAGHEARKQRVESLLKDWKYKEAVAELRKLSAVPELGGYVKEKLALAKKGPAEAKANADALARTAKKLVDEYDFQGAVDLLDGFPKAYRTSAFQQVQRLASTRAEEVADREFAVEQLLLNREYESLKQPVEELLEVQPTNRLGKKIKAAMEGTVKAGSRLDVHGTTVELDEIRSSSGGVFAGFLPIVLVVVLLAGGATWGLMHLLWAAPGLTANFTIADELLDGTYEFLVDGEVRDPEVMVNGLAGLRPGVHEIVVRKDGEELAKVNVDIPAENPPTIHIALVGDRVVVSTQVPKDDGVQVADGDEAGGTDTLATAAPITIQANKKDGFPVGPVAAGTKIELQYVSGKWKGWGSQPDISPDKTDGRGDGTCHLVLADLGDGSGDGTVLVTVPEGTAQTPFEHVLAADAQNLVLRIKDRGDGWDDNPGAVNYKVLVDGKSLGSSADGTPIVVDLTVENAKEPGRYHQWKIQPKQAGLYTLITDDDVEKVEVVVHSGWGVGSHPGPAGHLEVNGTSVLRALTGKGTAHFNVENGITGKTFNTENESYRRATDITGLLKSGANTVRYRHEGYVPWGLHFRVTRRGEPSTTVDHGVPGVPTGLTIAYQTKNYSGREWGPVRFSNDGRLWMTLDGEHARIWETETGDFVQKIKVGYPKLKGPFYGAFDAANEKVVFTGSPSEPVYVFNVRTGLQLASHALPSRVTSHHTLDIDSNRLLFKDGTRLMAMDLATGRSTVLGDVPSGLGGRFAVNPGGTVGLLAGTEGRNLVRNMETGADMGSVAGLGRDQLEAWGVSNDGSTALVRQNSDAVVLDLATMSVRSRFQHHGGKGEFAMDGTGKWLLTNGSFLQGMPPKEAEKTLCIWSTSDSSKPLVTLKASEPKLFFKSREQAIFFSVSPDGRYAATVGHKGETVVYRVEGT